MTTAQAAGLIKGKASVLTRVSFNTDAIDALPPPPPEPVTVRLSRQGENRGRSSSNTRPTVPNRSSASCAREDNRWEYLTDRKKRIAHIRIGMLNRGTASGPGRRADKVGGR